MMIYYCLSFLIGEVWLDLRNNILLGIILFYVHVGDFPYSVFEPSGLDPHSGLASKGLNAGAKKPECFNGHVSPLWFSKWA